MLASAPVRARSNSEAHHSNPKIQNAGRPAPESMKLFTIVLGLMIAVNPAFAQDSRPATSRPVSRPTMEAPTLADVEAIPAPALPVQNPSVFRWSLSEREAKAEELITKPLSVNGVVITAAEIRRELLSQVGQLQLRSRLLDLLIDGEIAGRKARGETVEGSLLSPEEDQAAFEEVIKGIRDQYPNIPVEDVLASNKISIESLKRQLTQTRRFDRIFLPADPDAWPVTTEAALESKMGAEMVAQMKVNWKARKDVVGEAEADPGRAMWDNLMRQMVIQALESNAEVQTASDGLPVAVAQRVNGLDTLVADVWSEVRSIIHPEAVKRVRLYLARLEAVKQDLVKNDSWLSDEEFNAMYAEEQKIGEAGMMNLQMIVISMRRFPSMDAYKAIVRARNSYQKLIEDQLTDETLAGWLPRASRLMGLGETNVEVILLSVFDNTKGLWFDNAWAQAEERAIAVTDALVASEGSAWDRLLDANSDFFDPPQPKAQPGQPAPELKNKGRFGSIHRNRLMQMLGESEFTAFVDGSSIADLIYYDQEVDSIDGPFKGIHGYYMTRVLGRTESRKPISLEDEQMRKSVIEDYVMQHFIGYSNRVLAESAVVGL